MRVTLAEIAAAQAFESAAPRENTSGEVHVILEPAAAAGYCRLHVLRLWRAGVSSTSDLSSTTRVGTKTVRLEHQYLG